MIPSVRTYSPVNLDQLFDTLSPRTRMGLRGFIRGEAASIYGQAPAAHRTLQYLAPALTSTSNVTHELALSEPQFDSLLVQGAQTMRMLASRTAQLSQLVSNTNATTAAIASQSQGLEQALTLLGPTLNQSTSTFAGLRSTLDALDPLVIKSIPASRHLAEFAASLRQLTKASIPTVGSLRRTDPEPTGGGDLISLLQATPALARLAEASFPRQIKQFNDSQAQVDYFREFTPDVVAALTDLGQIGGYFDANGHYARTQPFFGAFGVDGANQLTSIPPSQRFEGLQVARTRCPGARCSPRRTAPRLGGAGLQQIEPSLPAHETTRDDLCHVPRCDRGHGGRQQLVSRQRFAIPGSRDLRRRRVRGAGGGREDRRRAGRLDQIARRRRRRRKPR